MVRNILDNEQQISLGLLAVLFFPPAAFPMLVRIDVLVTNASRPPAMLAFRWLPAFQCVIMFRCYTKPVLQASGHRR